MTPKLKEQLEAQLKQYASVQETRLLTSEEIKAQQQEFDEIKSVVTTLRNNCRSVKSAHKAVKLIAKNCGLTEERVKEILVKINSR